MNVVCSLIVKSILRQKTGRISPNNELVVRGNSKKPVPDKVPNSRKGEGPECNFLMRIPVTRIDNLISTLTESALDCTYHESLRLL